MKNRKATVVSVAAVAAKKNEGGIKMFSPKSKLTAAVEAEKRKSEEFEKVAVAEAAKAAVLKEQHSHINDPRDTMFSIANQIAKTGYPITLEFAGVGGVTIFSAEDRAAFERTVYANLSKEAQRKIEEEKEPLSGRDVMEALRAHAKKVALGQALAEAELKAIKEVTIDEVPYLLTKSGKIIDLDQNIVADVSDLDRRDAINFGIALTERVRAARAGSESKE